jgi:hypothetical protein
MKRKKTEASGLTCAHCGKQRALVADDKTICSACCDELLRQRQLMLFEVSEPPRWTCRAAHRRRP